MPSPFNKLILTLRKLGILRFGSKRYSYTSAKDMPAEALLDDVYDADKDLVTARELKSVFTSGKPAKASANNYCSQCGDALYPDDRFCRQCGAPLSRPTETSE